MVNFFTQIVEIMCKTQCKSLRISRVKLLHSYNFFIQNVKNLFFPPTFPIFPTIFPTTYFPLLQARLFHFSTDPTITTTIKFNKKNY